MARAGQRHGGGHGFRPKLAGANGSGATAHGFRFRKHRGREKDDANPPLPTARPGSAHEACSMAGGHRACWSTRLERWRVPIHAKIGWEELGEEEELTSATNFSRDGSVFELSADVAGGVLRYGSFSINFQSSFF